MKRITLALVAVVVPLVLVGGAHAKTAGSNFPGNSANGLFTSALTVSSTDQTQVNDQFMPGDTVVFKAFALDMKLKKLVTKKSAKSTAATKNNIRSFFIRIPLEDNDLNLTYGPSVKGIDPRYRWTANWVVPALYPTGTVHFEVFARLWNGRNGTFSQLPIANSQLTITTTPQEPFGPGPQTVGITSANYDVVLFGDTVNGTHPASGQPRPVGCTQTNVFKQGEQLVGRAYGYQLSDGSVLDMSNVTEAHFSVPGQPDTTLNWGSHGPTGQKVFYWTGAWNIPTDYPIGDINVHMVFKTVTGKTGTLDYPVTIIPAS